MTNPMVIHAGDSGFRNVVPTSMPSRMSLSVWIVAVTGSENTVHQYLAMKWKIAYTIATVIPR